MLNFFLFLRSVEFNSVAIHKRSGLQSSSRSYEWQNLAGAPTNSSQSSNKVGQTKNLKMNIADRKEEMDYFLKRNIDGNFTAIIIDELTNHRLPGKMVDHLSRELQKQFANGLQRIFLNL